MKILPALSALIVCVPAFVTILPASAASKPQGKLAMQARAQVTGLDGKSHGTVGFASTPHGVLIEMNLTALPAGLHAVHVHTTGKCTASDKFESAGGHFARAEQAHGFLTASGPHAGDLPNQTAAADGTLRASAITAGFTLDSLFDADGAAFVVHAKGDDYKSQPSGDAGDRLACGVIQRTP